MLPYQLDLIKIDSSVESFIAFIWSKYNKYNSNIV